MFLVVLKKIAKNKWMALCLLLGSLLATLVLSLIPIYTDAILQKMLIKDFQNYQKDSGIFPGRYFVKMDSLVTLRDGNFSSGNYYYYDDLFANRYIPELGVSVLDSTRTFSVKSQFFMRSGLEFNKKQSKILGVSAISGLEDHITIKAGTMMGPEPDKDGIVDMLVTEEALIVNDLTIGNVYDIYYSRSSKYNHYQKGRITGTFVPKDPGEVYWASTRLGDYREAVLINEELFRTLYVEEPFTYVNAAWFYALDYDAFAMGDTERMAKTLIRQKEELKSGSFSIPAIGLLEKYLERKESLTQLLWILEIPVLLLLVFYIFMVSALALNYEKNEIAVLKSRGASNHHILRSYFYESLILGGLAFFAGPFLALLLTFVLGMSDGFMAFVSRSALPAKITLRAFGYAGAAYALFVITLLLPVFKAAGTTIVKHKQSKGRVNKSPFWCRFFLDFILLALSGYGLYIYDKRQELLLSTGVLAKDVPIDPLLFIISTLFILGAGLLFLRIYPMLVNLIYRAGKRFWPPVLYSSLINVSRSGRQNAFLMLFLILTVSHALFSATSARTINSNNEDRIRYNVGADITLQEYWNNTGEQGSEGPSAGVSNEPIYYFEPNFKKYEELEGVTQTTKVLVERSATARSDGKTAGYVTLMAVIPDEFGRTLWSRNDILPHHVNEYLNLMTDDPRAVLVSESLMEELGLTPGDALFIQYGDNQSSLECVVYAAVPYWVTYNPYESLAGGRQSHFLVANFAHVSAQMKLQPYEVWLKKEAGVESADIYKQLEDANIRLTRVTDASQQVIKMKNDPMIQGMNGFLTMSFLFTMVISGTGFLIYWILAIKGRTLQFGILRSMGLSKSKLVGMILCEQVLVSVAAIAAGIFIGTMASELFVPLTQLLADAKEQVPPYLVRGEESDYFKIYGGLSLMLGLGLLILGVIVRRININQALKLGED